MRAKTAVLVSIPGVLALTAGVASAQDCSASDGASVFESDCNETIWNLYATWQNPDTGGSTYGDYFGQASGNDYCIEQHVDCSGNQVAPKQVSATESFTSEGVDYDDVTFAWTITDKSPLFQYCSGNEYNETESDTPYTFGWYEEYCN